MADLLECLLQIKGLRETAERIAALLSSPSDRERWTHAPRAGGRCAADHLGCLAELEYLHGAWLRLMLASSARVQLPAFDVRDLFELAAYRRWDAGEAGERFLARRRDNLELLDACSAQDLARVADHPARRTVTLADIVALMLAGDVEQVGEIRRALGARAD